MTTSTEPRTSTSTTTTSFTWSPTTVAVLMFAGVLVIAAVVWPNLATTTVGMSMSMGMTHYMELLSSNQPRNLLVFMAVPVILAETLAISELAILFQRDAAPAWVRTTSRVAGLLAGPIMLAIALHLLINAAVPLSVNGGWRGLADVVAVGFYLSGAVPLVGITLVELGLIGTSGNALKWHATFIAIFLAVAHIAMIFGMLAPDVFGFQMHHL
jgi:hypothetical protein